MARTPRQQPVPTIRRSILRRVKYLYAIFFVLAALILGKIVYLQFGPDGQALRNLSRRMNYQREVLSATRGDILAADGRVLATNAPRYDLYLDFSVHTMEHSDLKPGSNRYKAVARYRDSVFTACVGPLADSLAHMFGDRSPRGYRELLERIRRESHRRKYVKITPRKINYLELTRIERFPLFHLGRVRSGLIPAQDRTRFRPHGSLAQRTVGRSGDDGRYGIEYAFDSVLRGQDGNTLTVKLYRNNFVPVTDKDNRPRTNGCDVVSTIDVELQDVAETMLSRQLLEGHADWGTVVLMEVQTGHVAAITNLTRYGGRTVEDYNYALERTAEPGSTFKLASLLALLEEGKMDTSRVIECGDTRGKVFINGFPFEDSHPVGTVPLREVFIQSSNIGFVRAVNEAFGKQPSRYVDFVRSLGFDKPLDLQLPGSRTPRVKDPADRSRGGWDGLTLMKMSYGYALEVTPLHTLMLYNAVANGGRMIRPLFVKRIMDSGETVEEFEADVVNPRICSPQTLAEVQDCLEGVVREGTARILNNPHYRVAGKTGTAQMAQGARGYMTADGGRDYLATLVGYFPADAPKYSCIVCIKTHYGPSSPRNKYYGASLAGPVFSAIADRVYASHTQWQESVARQAGQRSEVPVPVKGGASRQVREVARELSLPVENVPRREDWVLTRLDTAQVAVQLLDVPPGTVPDVVGMGLKDALYLCERQGLRVSFSGRGGVLSQSLPAGSEVRAGAKIVLRLGCETVPKRKANHGKRNE